MQSCDTKLSSYSYKRATDTANANLMSSQEADFREKSQTKDILNHETTFNFVVTNPSQENSFIKFTTRSRLRLRGCYTKDSQIFFSSSVPKVVLKKRGPNHLPKTIIAAPIFFFK